MFKVKNKPKFINLQLMNEVEKYCEDYFDEKDSSKELKFKNYFSSKKISCYSIYLFENSEEVIAIDIVIFKQNVNFYDFN